MLASPEFWIYAAKVVSSPTISVLRQPRSSQDVSFGVVIAITDGSAPARPLVSSITMGSSSSVKSITAKKLVSINNPKITGVIFFMSIPPKVRYASPRHALYLYYRNDVYALFIPKGGFPSCVYAPHALPVR